IRGHWWRSTPFDLLPWEMLLATLILIPLACVVSGAPAFEWTPALGALFVYAGLPGSALAYWAVAMAGRRLPAVSISLGLLATPMVSVVLATLWLGERPGASLVIAILLILGGVVLGTSAGAPSRGPGGWRDQRSRRHRQLAHDDAAVGQRVFDRVGDGARAGDAAALADTFDTERVHDRGMLVQHDVEPRQVV